VLKKTLSLKLREDTDSSRTVVCTIDSENVLYETNEENNTYILSVK